MGPNKFLNGQTHLPFVNMGPADPCKFFNGNSTTLNLLTQFAWFRVTSCTGKEFVRTHVNGVLVLIRF